MDQLISPGGFPTLDRAPVGHNGVLTAKSFVSVAVAR
jgi:hypothetical protein